MDSISYGGQYKVVKCSGGAYNLVSSLPKCIIVYPGDDAKFIKNKLKVRNVLVSEDIPNNRQYLPEK